MRTSPGGQASKPKAGTTVLLATFAHPILFAAFPVITLLGANIEMTRPEQAFRPALLVVGATMLVVVAVRLWLGDWGKAALTGTLVIATCFAFGQVRLTLFAPTAPPVDPAPEIAAFLAWVAVIALGLILLRRSRRIPTSLHSVLAIVALAAVVQPAARILAHEAQAGQPWALPSARNDLLPHRPQAAPGRTYPDIYYIILDGYGRSDVLKDLYELDETSFLQELEAAGFYVAEASRSNYAQTSLSFASALNMSYLDELTEIAGDDVSEREIARLIRYNEVSHVLRGLGYSVTAFSSGYRRAELSEADTFHVARPKGVSPFESLLLESTAIWGLRALLDLAGLPLSYPGYDHYRLRVQANIENLWESPFQPGPKFVFAHLLLPHPPFVFGPDGDPVYPDLPFRTLDGDEFIGSPDDYILGYRNQVEFAHHVVSVFLERLHQAGGDSAVVILQGDHGPGLRLDWSDPEGTDKRERLSILNAYRIPGVADGALRPSITPVNTFRLLFHELFEADYPQLPDRSYYSSWRSPYDFLQLAPDDGDSASISGAHLSEAGEPRPVSPAIPGHPRHRFVSAGAGRHWLHSGLFAWGWIQSRARMTSAATTTGRSDRRPTSCSPCGRRSGGAPTSSIGSGFPPLPSPCRESCSVPARRTGPRLC